MHPEAQEFQQVAKEQLRGRTGRSIRYSPELRKRAIDFVMKRRAEGVSLRNAAGMLGVNVNSISRWMKPKKDVPLKPVRVVEEQRTSSGCEKLVLVTPQGFRIEGLDIKSLAALLQALS